MKKFIVKLVVLLLIVISTVSMFVGCGSDVLNSGKLTLFYSDLSGVNMAIKRKSDLYKKYMELCGVDFTCLTAGGGQADRFGGFVAYFRLRFRDGVSEYLQAA